jgi:hypothetical protein
MVWALQLITHDVLSADVAPGVHATALSQTLLQFAALPLPPLLPPQPWMLPTAKANKPTTPTMNAVSFVDMLESLLKVDGPSSTVSRISGFRAVELPGR